MFHLIWAILFIITFKKIFQFFCSKFISKRVIEISSKTAKNVLTVPKTIYFKKVSTLPITVLKSMRYSPAVRPAYGYAYV